MKNIVRLLTCAALTLGLSGCSLDEVQVSVPVAVTEGGEGHISILYEVEGDMPLTTRGIAASAHEKDIRDVYILFFDTSDTEVADRYVGCTRTSPSPGTSTIKFDLPEDLKENTDYKLLAVGNADSYAGDSDSYEDFLKGLSGDYTTVRSTLLAERKEAVTKENPGLLPLCGRFVGKTDDKETTFSFYKDGEDFIYPNAEDCMFRFQRAICRIDLHNLVGNVLDIQQVRVVNIRTKGSFFIDGFNRGDILEPTFSEGKLGPGAVDMPEISQGEFEEGTRNTLQRLEAELYSFPNTVNTCLPNDKTTTALMISGYYTDPANGKTDDYLTYYRLNLNNAGEAQSIQRNYCYRASIKGVNRRGERNEQDAYNSTSPVFKYDIGEEWNTDDDNVVTDDKGNFLVVSKSLLTFTGDQSGADVIKLTVNTSDNMEWHIEMDEKSSDFFSFSIISDGTDDKIKAFTCGPNQKNTSDHYYTGSLVVVAVKKDKDGEILSELRKEIQLVQLTTNADVNCLIVNDNTKSFVQQVSKYGQTISYKVITGNSFNTWTATDVDGKEISWGEQLNMTTSGTSGNLFTITFPANIKEDREMTVKFKFTGENSEGIEDIFVTFKQPKCELPLKIIGMPESGELTLDCFNADPGTEAANCVAQSKMFTVELTREDETYYEVSSTFDKYRDLTLSETNGKRGNGYEIYSTHPNVTYKTGPNSDVTDQTFSTSAQGYYDKLPNRTKNKPLFWINAFRMGPGDPPIIGKIIVQVKDLKTNTDVPNGRLELTVRLEAPADRYMLNDVMIKNNSDGGGWVYVMDRNLGCTPRIRTEDSKTIKTPALWGTQIITGKTDSFKITGFNLQFSAQWLGRIDYPYDGKTYHYQQPKPENRTAWKNELKNSYSEIGDMYSKADSYPWDIITKQTLPAFQKNICFSKGRAFLIADVMDDTSTSAPWPKDSNGNPITVACWLPTVYDGGYGFSTTNDGIFNCHLVYLAFNSRPDISSWGTTTWGNPTGYLTHLIRLMYMIGNTNSGVKSLAVSEITPQQNYYKNHILKCYEAQ